MDQNSHKLANALMTMDILNSALENADSPSKLGYALTHELRDLVGGKAVVLLQFKEDVEFGFEIVGISPERKIAWTQHPLFVEFVLAHRCDNTATIIISEELNNDYKTLLATWQVSNLGLVPIKFKEDIIGFLVFWDLHEIFRIHGVISTLNSASPFIGTVLKNSQFFQNQEEIIARRTQEINQKVEDIALLLNSVAEGIYGIDLEGKCTFINRRGLSYLGYHSQEELIGKYMHSLIHEDTEERGHISEEKCEILSAFKESKNVHIEETVFFRKDKTAFFVEVYFNIQYVEGVKIGAVVTFLDITQRKKSIDDLIIAKLNAEKANRQLEDSNQLLEVLNTELSSLNQELTASNEEIRLQDNQINDLIYKDALTNLNNRFAICNAIDRSIETNLLTTPMAVLFLDIDNFKFINDVHGHKVGDLVIRETGNRLKHFLSNEINVGRFGGDEFLIFINHLKTQKEIDTLTNQIKLAFEAPIVLEDNKFYLTLSIGISIYPEHGTTREDLIKTADQALYKAKESGKNKATTYDCGMNTEIEYKINLQNHIKIAFSKREFYLNFQPCYYTISKAIVGFEALIRWNSPELGFINPYELITNAEEMGLIIEIGEWVFREACIFAKKINGISSKPLCVSINISAVQLMDVNFRSKIINIVQEVGILPSLINLEMTETILINSLELGSNTLKELREVGFGIALDDFGTGYSSLKYFKELPVTMLKIDKAFIDNLRENTYDFDLVNAMLIIAHNRNVAVVAEGVETEEQYQLLLKQKCDIIQGYLFSKPVHESIALDMIHGYYDIES